MSQLFYTDSLVKNFTEQKKFEQLIPGFRIWSYKKSKYLIRGIYSVWWKSFLIHTTNWIKMPNNSRDKFVCILMTSSNSLPVLAAVYLKYMKWVDMWLFILPLYAFKQFYFFVQLSRGFFSFDVYRIFVHNNNTIEFVTCIL